MFRVSFGESVNFQSFLQVNVVDYVDVLLRDSECYFITNSNEAFAIISCKAEKSLQQEDVEFRIDKRLLTSVREGEAADCVVADGKVSVTFYDASVRQNYSCSFVQQVVPNIVYADKLELVQNLPEVAWVEAEEFSALFNIARTESSLVCVENGIASVMLRSGARVYKKVKTGQSFSLTDGAFRSLRKCSRDFCNIKNFLIAKKENFVVAVSKARQSSDSEYELITSKKFGAKFVAEMDLSRIFQFFARTQVKPDTVSIDALKGVCKVSSLSTEFSIPVMVSHAQLANGAEVEPIFLAFKMIRGVLCHLGTNVFTVKIKKNFIQFEAGGFIVVV